MSRPVIDVHGMTREEAVKTIRINLKPFHDEGYPDVTIIHGHGKGILKSYVRSMLENVPYVKKIKAANNDGATIAEFS